MPSEAESAILLLLKQRDRAPWFRKPQWYWHGWSTLIPITIGHDEYARRTLMLGWTITGRIIIPLWDCGDAECQREAIRDLQSEGEPCC